MLHEDEDAQDVQSQDAQELSELRRLSRHLWQLAIDPQVEAPPGLHAAVMAKAKTLPPPRKRLLERLRDWLWVEWDLRMLTRIATAAATGVLVVVLVRPVLSPLTDNVVRSAPLGLVKLARELADQGQLHEAAQLYTQAERLLADQHAQTLVKFLDEHAVLVRKLGRNVEADSLEAQANTLRDKSTP